MRRKLPRDSGTGASALFNWIPNCGAAHARPGNESLRLGEMEEGRETTERLSGDSIQRLAYQHAGSPGPDDKFVRAGAPTSFRDVEGRGRFSVHLRRVGRGSLCRTGLPVGFTRPARSGRAFPRPWRLCGSDTGAAQPGRSGRVFRDGDSAGFAPRAEGRILQLGIYLWHEYAHVITLQMTNTTSPLVFRGHNRSTRNTRARPGWGDGLDASVHQKPTRKEDPSKVSELNRGMMRPRFPEQIGVLVLPRQGCFAS